MKFYYNGADFRVVNDQKSNILKSNTAPYNSRVYTFESHDSDVKVAVSDGNQVYVFRIKEIINLLKANSLEPIESDITNHI